MIRGAIAGLPESEQQKVKECTEKLHALMAEYKDHGKMALALLGAESASE